MTLKTYRAPTMAEALAEVKRDLGRDAVILHPRSFRKGGLLGIRCRPMWEITASPNLNVPERIGKGTYVCEPAGAVGTPKPPRPKPPGCRRGYPASSPWTPSPGVPGGTALPVSHDLRRRAGGAIHHAAHRRRRHGRRRATQGHPPHVGIPVEFSGAAQSGGTGSGPGIPPELHDLHTHLVDQDVQAPTAAQLITCLCMDLTGQQLADRQVIRQELRRLVAQRIRTAGKDRAMPAAGQRAR